jgi:hypothetical protein
MTDAGLRLDLVGVSGQDSKEYGAGSEGAANMAWRA